MLATESRDGADVTENVLCLCPNCHVLLDDGAIVIQDDLTITTIGGKLRAVTGHTVSVEHVWYHREHYGPTK